MVIVVWLLGIRLMSLLTPGLQSSLLLVFTFIQGSQVRCHHLIIFHWNHRVWGLFILDQEVAESKQGLDCILTDSIETPELDTSLDEPDVTISSVFSGFLHLVSTVSDTCKPHLAPSIRSCKLWCQARELLSPVSLATQMFASKLIHYFSNHPSAFGFQSSAPPDNFTLNPANRKADQNLSEFWTAIGAAAHATLNMEQLISCIRIALVDTVSPLSYAEGGVILVSEVHE